jgi:hypothetical protein
MDCPVNVTVSCDHADGADVQAITKVAASAGIRAGLRTVAVIWFSSQFILCRSQRRSEAVYFYISTNNLRLTTCD